MTPAPSDPLDLTDEVSCLAFKIRRAARAISQRYDATLAPHGLTTAQFNLLAVMARSGLRSVSEIAAASTTDRTTLNRSLGILERDGLVESTTGRDKRTRRFRITGPGRKRYTTAREDWLALQGELQGSVSRSRFERLHADLDVLLERL